LSWRALPSNFCISDANTSSRICTKKITISKLTVSRRLHYITDFTLTALIFLIYLIKIKCKVQAYP
jgi:hypothetical protein